MTALNFPTSPNVGDLYTANGYQWQWNGTAWISYNPITALNGVTINNSPIGGTTPNSGAFTYLNLTSNTVPSNGLYLPNGNTLGFASGGTQGMVLDPNQRLLIGTTASGNDLLQVGSDALIHGLTVGTGAGNQASSVAIGVAAGNAVDTGNNVALGYAALQYNTAANNTAIGFQAMGQNTTGTLNTAVGRTALYNNIGGGSNTGVGFGALQLNLNGNSNTAVGYSSLNSNTASNNTAVGYDALYTNSTGTPNTAVGYNALYANLSGTNNVAVGDSALAANTGSSNVALGSSAGATNTSGNNSTFIGANAGQFSASVTGRNTFIGASAGSGSSGTSNTFVGTIDPTNNYSAGNVMTTGSSNTIIGAFPGNAFGLDIRASNNYIVLSDGSGNPCAWMQQGVTGWFQQNNSASWSVTSDARLKSNITDVEYALDVIKALRPVDFTWNETGKSDTGFIAQEFKEVLPEQVIEKEDGHLSITQNLVPYLVAAIKELTARLEALEAK